MRNFFTALFWFLILAFVALLLHYFIGEKLCGVCHNDANDVRQEQVKQTPTTNLQQKLSEFMIMDTKGETTSIVTNITEEG